MRRILFKSNRCSQISITHHLRLSPYSKSTNPKKTEQTHPENQSEKTSFASLFDEITEIIGNDVILSEKSPLAGTHSVAKAETSDRPPGVCENVQEKLGTPDVDVSPIVHKITNIVRGENDGYPMEVLLEKGGFQFDVEVVDKVLKRCFKVPQSALRFFNWVKMRNGFAHVTQTYNTMIYIAGEAKEFHLVEELVEEMEKNSCPKNHKTWTIQILHYGNAKMPVKALSLLEKMKKSGLEPDEVVYKTMLRLLCNVRNADIAMEFYKEMVDKNMEMNVGLYKLLLKCLTHSGDIAGAQSITEDMIKISEIPECHAYACLLKSLCISGRIREALQLIRDLKQKDIPLDAENFQTLVKGLCRADKISDALEIVEIMRKRNSIDGKIYGIVINGYLRRNDVSSAFDLFQSIKDSGFEPTISTYTELIQNLFRVNEFEKASLISHEMLNKGRELDGVAVTAIVAGHIRQRRTSEAWEILENMEERGVKITQNLYSIFIKELCEASQTEEIFWVLSKMQASKVKIRDDIFHLVKSYLEGKAELQKLEYVKQMHRVLQLSFEEFIMKENPIFTHYEKDSDNTKELGKNPIFTHNEKDLVNMKELGKNPIVTHYEKDLVISEPPLSESSSSSYNDQDLKEAYQVLSSSNEWHLVQKRLESCCLGFTPALVLQILGKCNLYGHISLNFFSWVGNQAGYLHTTETYNAAIKIAGRGKDFKHMRALFWEMQRKGFLVTSDTWTISIMQYGRAGLTEIALKTFMDMKSGGCKPNGSTYKYLIICLCGRKGTRVDEAVKLFQDMVEAGFIPDKELIEIYLQCLCRKGKLSDARRCIVSLKKSGYSVPLAYSLYVRSLCRAGRLEEALALFKEVGLAGPTLARYTYGSLVHELLRRGRLNDALAKVGSMKEIGINPTVHVYTSLIVHYCNDDQMRKALEVVETMKKEGVEPTVITYTALIRGYLKTGMTVDAWDVFCYMKANGPVPDFKTYSTMISGLCGTGKSEEAVELISEMVADGVVPSAVNFRTIFFGLNREGKQELARNVVRNKVELMKRRKFLI